MQIGFVYAIINPSSTNGSSKIVFMERANPASAYLTAANIFTWINNRNMEMAGHAALFLFGKRWYVLDLKPGSFKLIADYSLSVPSQFIAS